MTAYERRIQKNNAKSKLAKELDITNEKLLEPHIEKRVSFELYKSNVCQQVKVLGDIPFIIKTLENDTIHKYYKRNWYPESLYLLAMLDYLSRLNDVPLCNQYEDLRHSKLSSIIYPSSILTAAVVSKSDKVKKQALKEAIPEFMRFNIVENDIRNVL